MVDGPRHRDREAASGDGDADGASTGASEPGSRPSPSDDVADSDSRPSLSDDVEESDTQPSQSDGGEEADPLADGSPDSADERVAASGSGPRGREVVVPDRVYKRVTVFSTLFAVVAVVAGFVLLDEATDRATAPVSEIDTVLALVGLGCIVVGAVTYAFSTRFRAEGMGNAKDEADEPANNG